MYFNDHTFALCFHISLEHGMILLFSLFGMGNMTLFTIFTDHSYEKQKRGCDN